MSKKNRKEEEGSRSGDCCFLQKRRSLNCHLDLIDGREGFQNPPTGSEMSRESIWPPKCTLKTGTFIFSVPKDSIYFPLQKHICVNIYLLRDKEAKQLIENKSNKQKNYKYFLEIYLFMSLARVLQK